MVAELGPDVDPFVLHLAPEAIGLGLDDIEDLFGKGAHQLPGIDRADPPDHPRGQVFFDAFGRCRFGGTQEAGLELLAMSAVVDPFPRRGDRLAGRIVAE